MANFGSSRLHPTFTHLSAHPYFWSCLVFPPSWIFGMSKSRQVLEIPSIFEAFTVKIWLREEMKLLGADFASLLIVLIGPKCKICVTDNIEVKFCSGKKAKPWGGGRFGKRPDFELLPSCHTSRLPPPLSWMLTPLHVLFLVNQILTGERFCCWELGGRISRWECW